MADTPYLDHFGLKQAPFSIAPDPAFLYLSDRHREALAHLVWALRHDGGFVVLTGEVGTGKTTLSRCLLEQIPADTDIAYLLHTRLDASGLLAALRKELGDTGPAVLNDRKQVDRIHEHLLAANAAGRRTLLLIDEAQNLSADVLEQLRLLTNLETSERKLLQVILLGQPELDRTLRQPQMRQLDQRVTARYHLQPLPRKALAACIRHRLQVAGGNSNPFSAPALLALHRVSGGIPRLANLIADRALLGAYASDRHKVSARMVLRAAREVRGQHRTTRTRIQRTAALGAAAAGLALAALLVPALQPLDRLMDSLAQPAAEPTTAAATTTAETAALSVSPQPRPVPLPQTVTRPEPAPSWATSSRREAFQSVLDSWYVPLTLAAGQDPCDQVGQVGLACIEFELSVETLREFDLPAVLHLTGPGTHHASLVGWHEDSLLLGSPATPKHVQRTSLDERWQGASTLLWQLPPSYDGPLRDGSRGPSVTALQEALQATGDLEVAETEIDHYDASSVAAVRRFQERKGIQVDGVAGPQTWILLLRETGTGIPSLREAGAD